MSKAAQATLADPNGSSFAEASKATKYARRIQGAARALLAAGVRSYVATCATIRNAHTTLGLSRPDERIAVDGSGVAIGSRLASLTEEEALRSTRMSLAKSRNKSATLAPVNSLPPEILAYVFALSGTPCAHDRNTRLDNFTGVGAYWRWIAITTTDLWTHIDICPRTLGNLAKLRLGRSADSPLHVHVYELSLRRPGDGPSAKPETSETIQTLTPHIRRVRTLDIESYTFYPSSYIGAVLNLWLDHGNPNLARYLSVYRPNNSHLLSPEANANGTAISTSENAEKMLASLRTLHLQSVLLDWDSTAYRGLVDLRLSFIYSRISISISQLADILSASPYLSVLKLDCIEIIRANVEHQPTPIRLNSLKVLTLLGVSSSSLRLLLSLIVLPSSPTRLSVGIPAHEEMHQLESFLARSQVTTLYLIRYSLNCPFPALMSLLESLPPLHTLVLHGFNMIDTPSGGASPAFARSTASSRLLTVVLLGCEFTFEALNILVGKHGVRELRLELCSGPFRGHQTLQDIQNRLLGAYPELQCSISYADLTRRSPYRTVFDAEI